MQGEKLRNTAAKPGTQTLHCDYRFAEENCRRCFEMVGSDSGGPCHCQSVDDNVNSTGQIHASVSSEHPENRIQLRPKQAEQILTKVVAGSFHIFDDCTQDNITTG